MLIELRADTAQADVAVLAQATAAHEDVEARPVRLRGRLFLAVSGDERLVDVPRSPEVLAVWSTSGRGYQLVARECELVRPSVRIGSSTVGGGKFWIAAGPCALESYDDALATCRALAAQGVDALRMGLFKPRSSPYHFPGKGRAGLRLLAELKTQIGLPVITEVLDPRDVGLAAEVADCLQVDTRNMTNRALLAELGRAGRPVLLMRGLRSTVAEWLRAAEFVVSYGNADVVLCARGVAGFDDSLAYQPDYGAILAVRRATELPVIFDPSHSTGRLDAVAPAALSAAAFGADGLLVESHCAPERMHVPGDAAQAYPPGRVAELIEACAQVRRIGRRSAPVPDGATRTGPGFIDLFTAQVRLRPHAIAAEQEGKGLTYAELDGRSERIARALVARGLVSEAIVALHLPPGPDLIAAMLGVLKASAAFLPLDVRSPGERLEEILRDAGAALVLVPAEGMSLPGGFGPQARAVTVEVLVAEGEAAPVTLPSLHPAALACVFYTSGSTSGQKGVMFTHRETMAFTEAMARAFRLSATDRVLQLAPAGFDVLLEEVLPVLAAGGTVILPRDPILESGADLTRAVEDLQVTGFELTAPYWQEWVSTLVREGRRVPACVRFVAMGGERVQVNLVAAWREFGVPLVHVYGLTEATVTTTCYRDEPGAPDAPPTPPLGASLPGIRVQVLGPMLEPVVPGLAGELFVTGGLARGYLGRPGATAARFVPSPSGPPGSRALRTGDLVRLESPDALHFVGRSDHQVKVNGFRIEPAEVEAALAGHPAVEQCLAIVREDRPGDKRLVAYLVPARGADPPDAAALRRFAAERLPDYMVPSAFVFLDAFPLTTTGKFDRKALPRPARAAARPARTQAETELELRIAALTAETLGLDKVAVDEDFFDLGGHSLLALRLLARMRAELGVDLSLRAMFQAPTPAGLSRAARLRARSDGDFGAIFPLRASGSRTPLTVIHPMSGLAWCYSALARELDAEIPVYGVQARGIGSPELLPESVEVMLDDYVDEIRRCQPKGPYRLLGWSFGGTVAQAIAARLTGLGEEVSSLIMLDAYPARTWDEVAAPGAGTAEPDVLRAVLADFGVDVRHALGADATGPELLAAARQHFGQDTVLSDELLAMLARAAAHYIRMLRRAEPKPFGGPVLFFTAEHDALDGVGARPLWGQTLTGRVEEYRLPCIHEELLGREMSRKIAPIVEARL